jgi:hypothetical protein
MGAPYALSSDLVSAWPAKSLEVAQYIDGQLPLIAMTQNAQTGTTYTLAATDFTKLVTLSNASPVAVTVPLESSVAWVAGTQLRLMNLGAGVVTVAGAVGVTINGSPLTLAQYKNATLTKTGTNTWTFNGSSAAPGMDLITPTSAVNGTVTASGQVTFSAASTVSLNGCFTSTYNTYKIYCDVTAQSAIENTYLRLRAAGTDNSSANYYHNGSGLESSSATSVTAQRSAGLVTAGFLLGYNNAPGSFELTLFAPALVEKTRYVASNISAGATDIWCNQLAGLMSVTTAYDGFTLRPAASGTLTGRISVYGLRN